MSESQSQTSHGNAGTVAVHLKVTAYERVASMIVALLILIGFLVFLLFLIWLTNRAFNARTTLPVEYLDALPGGDPKLGSGLDFEEPGTEQLQELAAPQLQDMLAAVSGVAAAQTVGSDGLGATSQGRGRGERRRAGAGGNATTPPWERWEVQFTSSSLEQYARQLDYFGVELAAAGGGRDVIDYAFNLTKSAPDKKSGSGDDETRLYMSWRDGRLQQYDRQLLARAGVSTRGRMILQFYPSRTEAILAALERTRAGRRPLQEIRKTVFGVRRSGDRFQLYVVDQQYH